MSDTRDHAQKLLKQLDDDFFGEVNRFLEDIQARRTR